MQYLPCFLLLIVLTGDHSMKIATLRIAFLSSVVFVSATMTSAQGCPGSGGCLDQTFGAGGLSTTSVSSNSDVFPIRGVSQSDGKILNVVEVRGSSFTHVIIRSNADGSVDSTFGTGGFAFVNWTGTVIPHGYPFGVAIQTVGPEERIVIAGSGLGGSNVLQVNRYLSDGSPDASFGIAGRVVVNAGYAGAIAIQPDGKILTLSDAGSLVRLNVNGTMDASFGTNGIATISPYTIKARSIALQSNGRIVAVGYSFNNRDVVSMTVTRFNTNGSVDGGGKDDSTKGDSFGTKGTTTVASLPGSSAFDVKVDGNGRLIVAGTANNDFAVVRLTTSGQLDTSFGAGGKTTVDLGGFVDIAHSVSVQSNGKIVLVGNSSPTANSNIRNPGLARFNSNGSLDTTFGNGGKVVSDFSSDWEYITNGVIQQDPICGCEKIIAIGAVTLSGSYYALSARYLL